MAMETLSFRITGTQPLLMNNPQAADRFNKYGIRMKQINDKKTGRTDEDYREMADLEIRSALYFDKEIGVYVPSAWIMAAIAKNSHAVTKISKEKIRGSVFPTEMKLKLFYKGQSNVKTPEDIVGNELFRHRMILGNAGSRKGKSKLIFDNWSFIVTLDYDNKRIDGRNLFRILEHAAHYGGFGDFRPTWGRGEAKLLKQDAEEVAA